MFVHDPIYIHLYATSKFPDIETPFSLGCLRIDSDPMPNTKSKIVFHIVTVTFLDSVSYLCLLCSTLRQSTRRCRPCPPRTITSTTSWPAPSKPWQRQSQPFRRWKQGWPSRWPLRLREGELLLSHVGCLILYMYIYNSVYSHVYYFQCS